MKEVQGLMITGEDYIKLAKSKDEKTFFPSIIFKRQSEKICRIQTRKLKKSNPEKPGEYDSILVSDISIILVSADGENIPKQTRWLKCCVSKTTGSWENMFIYFEPWFLDKMKTDYTNSSN